MASMIFDLIGRDRLSHVFNRAGDNADDMARRVNRASDDSGQAVARFTTDANGRLHDAQGHFASVGAAGQRMGDDVDGGSRRGTGALSRLLQGLRGAGSAAAGAVPSLSGVGGALQGVGIAAAITALPAVGALIPMLVGLGLAAVTAKLAFSGVGTAVALAGTDNKKYKESLKKMGPEQREFTKTVVAAKKEFAGFGKEIQKIVLPSFTKALKSAEPAITVVKGGIESMAEVLADFGDTFGKLFGSNQFQDSLRTNLSLGTGFIEQLISPLAKFTQSLLDFGAASKPTLDAFGKGIGDLLGKGLPGLFEGLKGGISGSAQMFTGLFDAVNMLLPPLGKLVGAIASAAGPALKDFFESTGTTGAGALRSLADGVKYLKPLFGEVAGAARVFSIGVQAIGTIAKDVGKVVLESLWPSFRQADNAVGPLQRLAGWLTTNKGAVQEFTRAASAGIIDFVSATVQQLPNVIQGFRLMATGILTAMDGILSGAAYAFGWIPGLGPKLQKANTDFDQFKDGFISSLHDAEDKSRAFADTVGPRLAAGKLRMNIDNWNSQIAVAKDKLSDKNLPPSKKAQLLANIADLQAKVRQAKRDLDSVKSKTVNLVTNKVTIVSTVTGKTVGHATSLRNGVAYRASGGPIVGPGTGTSDDVPIMASNGEYMVRAAAVSKYGTGFLDALNSGTLRAFAKGGKVSNKPTASSLSQISKDSGKSFIVSLTGTGSQISSVVKKLVDEINKAFKGKKSKIDDHLVDMLTKNNKKLQTLATARDKIAAKIAEAKQFAKDTTANAKSTATLSALGTDSLTAGGGGIKAGLAGKLVQIKQFTKYIQDLAKRGLSKTLLRQILEMGPETGFAYASTLAGSSKATLSAINSTQSQIDKASTSLGRSGADILYDSGKNAGKGFLKGLEGQQKSIEDLMLKIAKGMQKAIKKALGIKSPSRVMATLGGYATEGLAVGMLGRMPVLNDALGKVAGAVSGTAPAFGRPALAAGVVAPAGGWSMNVNINVQSMDPLAAAREIRRVLLELKRTHGVNINLGVA